MTTRKKATSSLSTLSPILAAIATANDKATLLRTITTQLLPLLGGDRIHLFVINEEENYHVDLAAKGQEGNSSDRFVATGQHPYQGSILCWMIKQIEATHAPILFSSKDLKRRFPDDPQWKEMPSSDQEFLAGLLKAQGSIVGLFCLEAQEDNNLAEVDTLLFRTISDQLAAALSILLLKEQLVAEQQFKETLLSINEAVASASDRKELLGTIYQRIRPIFAYDSYGLFVLSEDQQYHYELIDAETMGNDVAQLAIEEKFGAHYRYPHAGSVIEAWIEQGPGLFLLKDYMEHPQAPLLWEVGLRQFVAGPLTYRGEVIGMLCFSSQQEDFYSEAHLPSFVAISEQLSMAVANVLVSERVLAEKAAVEKLRTVSKVMATIQHRSQLKTAFDRVREVLPFDRAGLFVLTPNGQQHYELLDTYGSGGEITPACIEARFGGYAHYTHANSPIAHMMHADSVALYDVNDLSERFPDHPQHTAARSAGVQQMMAAPLRQGERVIGLLTFSSKQADQYHPADFMLFQSIAELMSTVVSHVVPNEREREERHFKETILSISEASTRIRDREDLYQTVMEKVHPITLYDDAVVAILSEDRSHSKHVLTMSPVQRKAHPLCQEIMNNFVPVEGGPFEDFLAQDDIAQYSLEDWLQRYPNHVGVRLMHEIGLNDSIVLKLRSGGEVFAFLLFHFKKARLLRDRDKPLYINIADQLAVAVSNVLANEKLLEEKQFKETLLDISEAATRVRDREGLLKIIKEKIHPIIQYADASVATFSEDYTLMNNILVLSAAERMSHPSYREAVNEPLAIDQGLPKEYLEQKDVSHHSLDEMLSYWPDSPGLRLMKDTGLVDSVILRLRSGDKVFGLLTFHFTTLQTLSEQDESLYLSVADQLAVAVSNVLANERIQEREREKALLLSVINALNQGQDWKDKLRRASQQLRTHIPFTQISFGASQYSESFPNYGFEQIGPDEYRTLDLADFFKMSDMTPEAMATALSQRTYQQTTIVDTATFRRGTEENALEKAIWEVFGTRSFMVVPVALKKEEGMYVVFYSRQEDFYQEEHRQLLDNIRSSFGLALEKHLNYEKIAQLNARLTQEKTYLEEEIKTHYNFDQIIGESPAMQKMFTAINQVAFTDSTVLLQGETGTGKELAARALHKNSPRCKQSLIKVNCASLPPQLIESELFGHEKGAFTGAVQRRIGKFELANSSTIFLDEIGELPLEVQSKLLRVLQEKEFERLGSNQVRRVNARVVAATNRDLSEEVQQGRFRRDLYFRLNVFPIQLPPLRERGEDIALLAHFFVEKYTTKYKKRLPPLDESQLQELLDYAWPGNVRELEHLLERAVIQASEQIGALNLPVSHLTATAGYPFLTATGQDYTPKSWKETEVEMIISTLRYCNGKVRGEGGAAQLLDLHPNTLESRMKKLGIKRQHIITE